MLERQLSDAMMSLIGSQLSVLFRLVSERIATLPDVVRQAVRSCK
jgi:hypothetical protein